MGATYEVKVPGRFAEGVAFLDLETWKVPVEGDFRMANGEPLRKRWSVALAGVGRDGKILLIDPEESEWSALFAIGEAVEGASAVVYGATREFDEMICRGRFTNARRAHLSAPAFPAVPGAEDLPWQNRKTAKYGLVERGADVPSRDVPEALRKDHWDRRVWVHLLRDVADLILLYGSPNAEATEYLEKILTDFDFAVSALKF